MRCQRQGQSCMQGSPAGKGNPRRQSAIPRAHTGSIDFDSPTLHEWSICSALISEVLMVASLLTYHRGSSNTHGRGHRRQPSTTTVEISNTGTTVIAALCCALAFAGAALLLAACLCSAHVATARAQNSRATAARAASSRASSGTRGVGPRAASRGRPRRRGGQTSRRRPTRRRRTTRPPRDRLCRGSRSSGATAGDSSSGWRRARLCRGRPRASRAGISGISGSPSLRRPTRFSSP